MDSEPSNSKSETSTDHTATAVPVRNTIVDSISDLNVAHHNLELYASDNWWSICDTW